MRHIVKFRPRGTPYGKFGQYMEPLILWVIGIRLKEADSEASCCGDMNFYRKKTQMSQINGNLDITAKLL